MLFPYKKNKKDLKYQKIIPKKIKIILLGWLIVNIINLTFTHFKNFQTLEEIRLVLEIIEYLSFIIIFIFTLIGLFKKRLRTEMFLGAILIFVYKGFEFLTYFFKSNNSWLVLILPVLNLVFIGYLIFSYKVLKINLKKVNLIFSLNYIFILIKLLFISYQYLFFTKLLIKSG